MTTQLQDIVREKQQVPPLVYEAPPPLVPAVGTVHSTPPPILQVPQAPAVALAYTDPSKLSKKFQKHRPPTFGQMANDTLLPAHWIRDLERIFYVLQCIDTEKIRCAVFQFRGEADAWWRSSKENFWATYPNATWAQFTELFEELFYFAPAHQKPDDVKARKFEKGLRPSISTSVVLHEYPTYTQVVQAAKIIEDQQRENYWAI
ncbi:uncharacterized protein LOC122665497 [Telopea speciosissima]|uniref:uncharacterized protein LOC122665497 n=1 Tax=Telopea speciosissima TaxID=54955 RepID=UPI001CC7D15A|nr:uncharacterized protein LOC122665497 [Telopea speciosissima]